MNFPGISIIIACLNEENFIGKCIDSLLNQSYSGEIEIIIADGGSNDNSVQIINEFAIKYSNIILINNPSKFQSIGRNLAIKKAKYDFVVYIDAHSYPTNNWLKELYTGYCSLSEIDDNIAGIGSIYLNASDSPLSKSIYAITKSFLCGATSNHYLNQKVISKVENASMCLYKKEILEKIGYFDENLKIGEDIELNQRFTFKYKYNIYVNPFAVFYYYPRDNFESLLKQQFRYGYWRQIVNRKNKQFTLKSFIPGIFVSFLLISLIFSIVNSHIFVLFNSLVLSYLFIIILSSLYIGLKDKVNPAIIFIIAVGIHLSYGLGGIYSLINRFK